MRPGGRTVGLCIVVVAGTIAGALAGCSPYAGISVKTRAHLERRDFNGALDVLAKAEGGKDRLLVLLEKGLVLHYAGEFDRSNEVFQQAEDLIEELYTRSVSTEALALLTSDRVRPYEGAEFELVMVHAYRALSYVALGQRDGALVEARKASLTLDLHTKDLDDPAYGRDAFVEAMTGLLYEWGGELNDAWISYRRSIEAYEAAAPRGGPPVPDLLAGSAIGVADRLGFEAEAEALRARYPSARAPVIGASEGEVIVIVETGFVPELLEVRVDVPILKTDPLERERVYHVAGQAYHRIGDGRERAKTSIAYILSIAYPVLAGDLAPPVREVTLVATGRGEDANRALGNGGRNGALHGALEHASDLAFNARENHEDRRSSILTKTIARALLKYIARKQAADKGGEVLGLAVDIFGSITERADVRSWRSLPRDVHLARLALPAGERDLTLAIRDGRGRIIERVTMPSLEVRSGEMTWVTYRSF